MSVLGELRVGLIRCTSRYDNISFIIKTPFCVKVILSFVDNLRR